MIKAKEDLKAILELQVEWCQKYGYEYLSTAILEGCCGFANTTPGDPDQIDVNIGYEAETPGAATPGDLR